VARCLARDGRERFRTAGELAVALDALVEASDSATGVHRAAISFDDEASTQIAARMPSLGGFTSSDVTAPSARAMTPTGIAPPPQPFPTIRTEVAPTPAFDTIRGESQQPPQPYPTIRTEVTPPPQRPPLAHRTPPPTRPSPPSYRSDEAQVLRRRDPTPAPPRSASPPLSPFLAGPVAPEHSPANTLRGIAVQNRPHTRTADTVIDDPTAGMRYDMSGAASRDARMRRLVWIAVLVLAAILGIGLAARL
jgi:hypothetical protein